MLTTTAGSGVAVAEVEPVLIAGAGPGGGAGVAAGAGAATDVSALGAAPPVAASAPEVGSQQALVSASTASRAGGLEKSVRIVIW
ncbi:MAG TPA: hypothetical protein VLJ42_07340 [Solirubrobacteraceae bacterium]|nr:hypothetical protein [Solirubrobacteraceae bacterium]